jgi:hypothetical protein
MAEGKTPWESASEWFARTLAIVIVMVAPGALGAWLDKRMETGFLTFAGFIAGMLMATGMLLLYTRINPTPPRRGAEDSSVKSTARPLDGAGSRKPGGTPEAFSIREKPSQSKLPHVPGAEILEPPTRDE